MAVTPTYVRKGKFAVSLTDAAAAVEYSCDPTSVTLTPTAGDTGDSFEVLCGDNVAGQAGPTTWAMALTSIQQMESANTDADSLVLWALANDGAQATFWFQASPTSKIFTGPCSVVAMPLGGEVGASAPTSEIEWPLTAKPTITDTWPVPAAPAAAAADTTTKKS